MKLRRFDTLFLRLFVLMWVTLVLSHFLAYVSVTPASPPPEAGRPGQPGLPPLPSLPPGSPFTQAAPSGPPPGPRSPDTPPQTSATAAVPEPHRPGLPPGALWLDYGLRALVIALGAALGARWIASPMRRLARASGELADQLARPAGAVPQLDERRGSIEVRETARVFNDMARRIRAQFDARGLQMAAVSHDLRTPLTRLRMRVEGLSGEAARQAVADVLEMDTMIESTLGVLREQQIAGLAQSIDLSALLQALADDRSEQGESVQVDLPERLKVLAHPVALKRALDNLVGNAVRHGGGARVRAVSRGATVLVHVDDDGPGIPPEQLEQVFAPWTRLEGGVPRAGFGHGLGLAIARDLIERDAGQVQLSNRNEGGLRATVTLPAG